MRRVEVSGLSGVEKRKRTELGRGRATAIRIIPATLTISLRSDRGGKALMNEQV